MALSVALRSVPPRCSATMRTLDMIVSSVRGSALDDLRLFVQLLPELLHVRRPSCRPCARAASASFFTTTFGARSTPSEAAASSSIGFFFAFMIPGSDAKRGLLRRRSVVTTAGSVTSSVSTPPSTSRTTWSALPSAESMQAGLLLLLRLALEALDLRGEGRLRPAEPLGEVLAGLVLVVVDRLLAEDDEVRLLLLAHLRRAAADTTTGSSGPSCFTEDAPVRAHRERGADLVCDFSPPIEATTTSPPCFSLSRSASSTAISSKGFIL